jgi:putative copper export protein
MCKYVQKKEKYIWTIIILLVLIFLLVFIQNILQINDLFESIVAEIETDANKGSVRVLQMVCNTAFLWIALVSSVVTSFFIFLYLHLCCGQLVISPAENKGSNTESE